MNSTSPVCSTTSRFSRPLRPAIDFRRGALSTDFIAEEFPAGFGAPAELTAADGVIQIAAALAETRLHEAEVGGDGAARRHDVGCARSLSVLLDDESAGISIAAEGGAYRVELQGESRLAATDWRPGNPVMHLRVEDRIVAVQVEPAARTRFPAGAPGCCQRRSGAAAACR